MKFELVVIGASWGGVHALQTLFESLPSDFPAAIAVVKHRDRGQGEELMTALQRHSRLPVAEAEDKGSIRGGSICLAPPDYHLLIEPGRFALSIEAPLNHARPAVDILFQSAADSYGEKLIGVILTGLNDDGAQGLARIKKLGGLAVVQDPATAEKGMMPAAAIHATEVDAVLPLGEIGPYLAHCCIAASA